MKNQSTRWELRDDHIYDTHRDVIDKHTVICSHAIFTISISCECGAFTTQQLHCMAVDDIRKQHARMNRRKAA